MITISIILLPKNIPFPYFFTFSQNHIAFELFDLFFYSHQFFSLNKIIVLPISHTVTQFAYSSIFPITNLSIFSLEFCNILLLLILVYQ